MQQSPRFDVTSYGEGQLRYSVPPGQRLEMADKYDVNISGTEANVTSLLSRLGWNCGWVSSMPNSPMAKRVYNAYMLSGLDLSAIQWKNYGRLATYYVEYAVPPRSTNVFYDRTNTCFTNMCNTDVDWDYILDTKIIHLSGLTMPLSENTGIIINEAMDKAKTKGITVSFDVNHRTRLWSTETAKKRLLPVLKKVDFLFCGLRDARTIFGFSGSPQEILEQVATLTSAKHIVMSMSENGLLGWDGNEMIHQPPRRVVVLDRIGAGDSMVGGVLHGFLQGDFTKGLAYGVTTASMNLSQYGDQLITSAEELEHTLNTGDQDIVR